MSLGTDSPYLSAVLRRRSRRVVVRKPLRRRPRSSSSSSPALLASPSPSLRHQQLVYVRDELEKGKLITHFLELSVSNGPVDPKCARRLHHAVFRAICNVPLSELVLMHNQPLFIDVTWTMPPHLLSCTSSHQNLYCASPLNDLAIMLHTKRALEKVHARICTEHPEFGNNWELVHLVTTPREFMMF